VAKRIMQYEMKQVTRQLVQIPVGSDILCADVRSGSGPTIWVAIDDTQKEVEARSILIVETGIPFEISSDQFKRMRHLGTYHESAFGKSFSVFEQMSLENPVANVAISTEQHL
jgi:hypothetical protein